MRILSSIRYLFSSQSRILRKRWNYLIVLDACRFDFFKEEWGTGVRPVRSPASDTPSWLRRTFPGSYPYTIYSSNPFINSRNIGHWKYQARDHFLEVIDLWDSEWSEEYGTVLPENVYRRSRKANPGSIIWFLQPHAPYLSLKTPQSPRDFIEWRPPKEKAPLPDLEKLRELYRHNLRMGLRWVRQLIGDLDPPILITSDHGELLGEYDKVGHPQDMDVPELRKVPLVVICEE